MFDIRRALKLRGLHLKLMKAHIKLKDFKIPLLHAIFRERYVKYFNTFQCDL